MERFGYSERRVRPDALIAYGLGSLAAYVIQVSFRFGGGAILSTLIIAAVGGLWYYYRKVL